MTPFSPAIVDDKSEPELRRQFFGDTPGYFVEVGAYDPEAFSQTFGFEQAGWRGVLVEPNPEKAAKLRQGRKATVYEVACTSPAKVGRPLPLHVAGMYSSLRSDSVTAGVTATHSIMVATRTLDDILNEERAVPPIDFVSIDVEGCELDVLDGFDLARWRPRLMVIEDLVLTLHLHRYLVAHGYRWVARVGLNGWYVPAAQAPALGLRGRWQFVRKYYLSLPFRHLREIKRRMIGRKIPPAEFNRTA